MNPLISESHHELDYTDLTNRQFKELMTGVNSVVLDVRTPEEYSHAHIRNSILIDIYNPDFVERIENLDRSKIYLVYCRAGIRSSSACRAMIQLGFPNVCNLSGGISDWDGEVTSN